MQQIPRQAGKKARICGKTLGRSRGGSVSYYWTRAGQTCQLSTCRCFCFLTFPMALSSFVKFRRWGRVKFRPLSFLTSAVLSDGALNSLVSYSSFCRWNSRTPWGMSDRSDVSDWSELLIVSIHRFDSPPPPGPCAEASAAGRQRGQVHLRFVSFRPHGGHRGSRNLTPSPLHKNGEGAGKGLLVQKGFRLPRPIDDGRCPCAKRSQTATKTQSIPVAWMRASVLSMEPSRRVRSSRRMLGDIITCLYYCVNSR
jgi:hypothetical protein